MAAIAIEGRTRRAQEAGLGTGGGRSRATTTESNAQVLWVLSQKGLVCDWPQRQRLTRVRPASPKTLPSWSTISKSPSIRSDPLFSTVMRVVAMDPPRGNVSKPGDPLYQPRKGAA